MASPPGNPAPGPAVPTAALDRGLIESIDLALWRLLLDSLGYPPGVTSTSLSHEALARALGTGTHAPLMEALQTIHDLNSDDARATLIELAEQATYPRTAWKSETPLALAVRVVAKRATDSAARRVVELALAVIYEKRSPEPVKEFAGNAPKAASRKS